MVNFTPVAIGATGNAALFNDPLNELDAVIEDIKDGNYYGAVSTLTIVSGIVLIIGGYHNIAAENGIDDDLDTINGGVLGQIIVIQPDSGDTITLTESGNIRTVDGGALIITGNTALQLSFDGSNWQTITPSGLQGEIVPLTQVIASVASVDINGIPEITGPMILMFGFRGDGAGTKDSLKITINGHAVTYQSVSRGDSLNNTNRANDITNIRLGDTNNGLVSLPGTGSAAGNLGVGSLLIHSGESQVRRWLQFAGHTIFNESNNSLNSWKTGARHTLAVAAALSQITFESFAGNNITEGFYALYAVQRP